MPPAGPARLTWQRCAAFQGVRARDLRSDSLPADGTGVGPAPPGNRRRRQRGDEREGVVLGLRRHLRDLRLSGKDQATRTWKSYGHHPLARLRRSRRGRAGETVGWLLRRRPGGRTPQQTIWWSSNRPSVSNRRSRPPVASTTYRPVLVRTDGAGATPPLRSASARRRSRALPRSTLGVDHHDPVLAAPAAAWTPAYNAGSEARDGAWVAEITGLIELAS